MKRGWFFTLLVLALACSSCQNNGLHPVHGKATYNGAPAVGAFVYLLRRGAIPLEQQSVMGVVRPDGSFAVVCDAKGEGAPAGEYDVLIKWPQTSKRGRGPAPNLPDRLQGRYADPKHPRWRVTIEAKTNELPPFELTN